MSIINTLWARLGAPAWPIALATVVLASALPGTLLAETAQPRPATTVLFQNVRIFDGRTSAISPPAHVLEDPRKNLVVIMKDSKIYKNALSQ